MEYIQLSGDTALPDISQLAPFKAVIAIEDSVDTERQLEICRWLVGMGCKYAMICGASCEGWEEIIRRLNLEQVSLDDMTPEQFIMITTHARERLRSVFWHAKKHARHSHIKMQDIITIHIGEQNRSVEYLAMFRKA